MCILFPHCTSLPVKGFLQVNKNHELQKRSKKNEADCLSYFSVHTDLKCM